MLTATDPNSKVTTCGYYADNDLELGKRGNLESGLATTLSYYPRGWLKDRNVGGELTSYAYDGVEQLSTRDSNRSKAESMSSLGRPLTNGSIVVAPDTEHSAKTDPDHLHREFPRSLRK